MGTVPRFDTLKFGNTFIVPDSCAHCERNAGVAHNEFYAHISFVIMTCLAEMGRGWARLSHAATEMDSLSQ